MNEKLLLIDGSSVLTTSFFGVSFPREYFHMKFEDEKNELLNEKLMKNSNGQFTNAVFGMTKILLNLIEKQKPTHIAICWDVNRSKLKRRQRYEGYKAQRKDTIPQLRSQFGLMQEVLEKLNIPQFKLEEHEADDIIGTFAKAFENEIPTYILTKDQDSLQLITEKTKVWLTTSKSKDLYKERGIDPKTLDIPDGVFEYDPKSFKEVYGFEPIQIIDMKALEGDSSDNIPGVKGVGPTAIIPLLNHYKTIEAIYEAVETIPEKELKTYFKNELGITRSPIANLTKKSIIETVCEKVTSFLNDSELKEAVNELEKLLNDDVDESILEKMQVINTLLLNLLDESKKVQLKDLLLSIVDYLNEHDSELVGKRAAFLSKELATIKTDLEEFSNMDLKQLELSFDYVGAIQSFTELEFKSLLERL